MTVAATVDAVAPAAPDSPYKGLVPFEDSELDALLFFGREKEREVIAANLLASRLTVLYGPSGVGKSSLLRAGVAHELRRSGERNLAEHGHPELAVATFANWTGDPVAGIQDAARRALTELFGSSALEEPEAGEELANVLASWTSALGCELLLIVDQAEEYFLYHEHESGPKTFAEQLPELVTRPGLRVGVLLAIREDALAKLDFFKGRIPNLFANYLRLDHLDRESARRAILGPVERHNELVAGGETVSVEPALVDAVLNQVAAGKVGQGRRGRGAVRRQARASSRVEAPYLQLVMQRIWEVERGAGSRVLRLSTLDDLGGASHITEEHLERALAALSPAGRDVAAMMFHHLVTPSGTKIAHRTADLAQYAHVPPDAVESVVDTLANQRILRPVDGRGRGTNGAAAHEIFHDVLGEAVVAWRTRYDTERQVAREREQARRRNRRLAVIVAVALAGLAAMTAVAVYALAQRNEAQEQAEAAQVAQQEAVAQAALARAERRHADREKLAAQRDRRRAVRSAARERVATKRAISEAATAEQALDEAEAARDEAEVARDEAEASEEEALAAKAEASEQAVAADREAANARRQTQVAVRARRSERAGRLAARSDALLEVDPELSVRLALRASSVEQSTRVEDALRRALRAIRLRAVFRGGGGAVRSAVFSPDGRHVVTAAAGGEVRIYRTRRPALVQVFRHPDVSMASFGPDGRIVVSAGGDRVARLWRADTGTLLQTLNHRARVTAAAVAGGGRLVVTGDAAGALRIWDVATGILVRDITHSRGIVSLALSRGGGLVVTVAAGDRVARVFDVASGRLIASLTQEGEVTDAAFSPRGDVVCTTGRRNAYLWETSTWNRRHLLVGHTGPISDVQFSEDGARVLTTGTADSVPRLWDVATGDIVLTFPGHHQQRLTAGAISPDGTSIATASADTTARFFAAPLGSTPVVLAGHKDVVTSVAFSPDGRSLLTASGDGRARLWDARGEPSLRTVGAHERAVATAEFSLDGSRAVSASADGTARIWRVPNGPTRVLRHGGPVTAARFVDGGRRVLTASEDGTARIWDADGGVALVTFKHGAKVRAVAADRRGTRFATAGEDGTARLWRADGKPLHALGRGTALTNIAFSPDGTLLATGDGEGVTRIWRVRDGASLHVLRSHEGAVRAVVPSPDGSLLVTAGDDSIARVWNFRTGAPIRELRGHTFGLTSIVFSRRDPRLVVSGSVDGDARVWNVRTGRTVVVFRGHVATIAQASFSPDGRWVVTAGPSTAGVWQTRTGSLLFFLRGHQSPLRAASFSPDGKRILTGGSDGTVRTYRCELCGGLRVLRATARARLAQIARPGR